MLTKSSRFEFNSRYAAGFQTATVLSLVILFKTRERQKHLALLDLRIAFTALVSYQISPAMTSESENP